MNFYLGLDAGGTKTTCAIADESGILCRVQGGSIKPSRVAGDEAGRALASLLREAAGTSKVALNQIASTCIGIAGLRLPGSREWIQSLLQSLVGGAVAVCGDEEIALDAAFRGGPGVLVVAGTGSNIVGRTHGSDGVRRLFNVGGWGPGIGDEGSGYWIGRRAINAAFRAYDRSEPTLLLDGIMRQWGASSLDEVVGIANERPGPDFSLLTPLTLAAAAQGDAVAVRVLTEAGQLLAGDALVAYRRVTELGGIDPGHGELPGIAFTGGILAHVELVRQSMIGSIRASLPAVPIVEQAVDAVAGAVWRAREAIASGV